MAPLAGRFASLLFAVGLLKPARHKTDEGRIPNLAPREPDEALHELAPCIVRQSHGVRTGRKSELP